jgi:hypothetical protein
MGRGGGMVWKSGYDIGQGGMGWDGVREGFVFISVLCLCVCGEWRESCALDESYSCSSGLTHRWASAPLPLPPSTVTFIYIYTMSFLATRSLRMSYICRYRKD